MERNSGPNLSVDQAGLLKYWVSKCRDGMLPLRGDVSPAELVFCLPCISIVERRNCGTDVFRLTASALRDILGEECRGRLLKDVCGRAIAWNEALDQAIKTRSPVFGQVCVDHHLVHQWMRLPLQPMENGRQPLLCYDRVGVLKHGEMPPRETMFVTANAFRTNSVLEKSIA